MNGCEKYFQADTARTFRFVLEFERVRLNDWSLLLLILLTIHVTCDENIGVDLVSRQNQSDPENSVGLIVLLI